MPTISDGLAGLSDCVFSAVFRWRPPMTRSYSRPSSLRTFSMAAFMRRAFSGLAKSTEGSFLKVAGIWALLTVAEMRVPSRAGVVVVAISASSQMFICAVLVDAVRSSGMRQKRTLSVMISAAQGFVLRGGCRTRMRRGDYAQDGQRNLPFLVRLVICC